MSGRFLVVDSGVGGLAVARQIRRQGPAAKIVYAADDAGFPYGEMAEPMLAGHVVDLVGRLVGRFRPDIVVIACNTASTLVLRLLRDRLKIPVVGTVPAIKPAVAQSRSGLISVLATPGTIDRDYTRGLIAEHAPDCHVRLVGSFQLALLAEALDARRSNRTRLQSAPEIQPAFVERDDRRTDVIVLGCTHYVFLLDALSRAAAWPVRWIDSSPAIARRALSLAPSGRGGGVAILTSGSALAGRARAAVEGVRADAHRNRDLTAGREQQYDLAGAWDVAPARFLSTRG